MIRRHPFAIPRTILGTTRAILVALALAIPASLGSALPAVAGEGGPRVVVSIKPLHSLVAGVMAGIGAPTLLIEGAATPHAASLRPSDARALDRAAAVFWVGPDLEAFLVRPLAALAAKARVVALGQAEAVLRLPARAGGAWEPHEHGEPGEHGEEIVGVRAEGRSDDRAALAMTTDPHVWLDPRNAQAMTAAIVATLSALDPGNAARYAANGQDQQARLAALEARIAARLAAVRDRPYVVFHDAYRYFEHRFGINAVGSVTISPERVPGARRIAALRDRIVDLGAVCILREPQFAPALVETLAAASGARIGVLDPLGADLAAGAAAYEILLEGLAEGLVGCLEPTI